MEKIRFKDKEFVKMIPSSEIQSAVKRMAENMRQGLNGKKVLFISILNGSFVFTSDLIREMELFDSEVSFLKLSSYKGNRSTGIINELIGLNEDIKGRNIVILEDIIDSGRTIAGIIEQLKSKGAQSVKVATMFYKPDALIIDIEPDYFGISIPNGFIVGYGLDYDGLGRGLKDIYTLTED